MRTGGVEGGGAGSGSSGGGDGKKEQVKFSIKRHFDQTSVASSCQLHSRKLPLPSTITALLHMVSLPLPQPGQKIVSFLPDLDRSPIHVRNRASSHCHGGGGAGEGGDGGVGAQHAPEHAGHISCVSGQWSMS